MISVTPDYFTELGYKSLSDLSETRFNLAMPDFQKQSMDYYTTVLIEPNELANVKPIPLRPVVDSSTVVGVDTSSIIFGETKQGILCAIRGTIVGREKEHFLYRRYGPFIFHVTEMNKYAIYNALRQTFLGANDEICAPTLQWMPIRICSILERWLQKQACESNTNSVLLWDGSLMAGAADSPILFLSELLDKTRDRKNTVLALSKKSKLHVEGNEIADLINNKDAPCVINIDALVRNQDKHLHFLGRVYVAKLAPSCCSFRLDVDRTLSEEESIMAINRLLGNDIVIDSYPETLRLAHILSHFSATEVLGMQYYIAENHDLKIVSKPNIRRMLFSVFGGLKATNW